MVIRFKSSETTRSALGQDVMTFIVPSEWAAPQAQAHGLVLFPPGQSVTIPWHEIMFIKESRNDTSRHEPPVQPRAGKRKG